MPTTNCQPAMKSSRRQFIQWGSAAIAGAAVTTWPTTGHAAEQRKMTIDLCCGRLGVRANQGQAIAFAARYGFESVEPLVGELAAAKADQREQWLDQLQADKLVWGAGGLPVEFRRDEDSFRNGIATLKTAAPLLEQAGVTRLGTWLSPAHDELTYLSNFRQHARRLREAAKVLHDNNLRLGLEYVGPKTSWTAKRYPFIHSMAEMRELIVEMGLDNVGLVLDSWHWYTAHESKADLESLNAADIIAVDLNDAPAGLEIDEQMDLKRELPTATGVIDVATFLATFVALGCDAPVRAEPFSAALRAMPPDEALAATAAAMKKAFALIV